MDSSYARTRAHIDQILIGAGQLALRVHACIAGTTSQQEQLRQKLRQLDPAQVQAEAWTLNRSLSTSLFCLLFSIGQENVARARAQLSKQVLSYVRPSGLFLKAVPPVPMHETG